MPTTYDMPSLLSASDSVAPSTQEPLPSFEKQALKIQQQALWQPNSTKAILWALLPGGGQIYNRKYWKLPIVWGAFMACYYSITWNNRQYQEYHAAYRDLSGPIPSTTPLGLSSLRRVHRPPTTSSTSLHCAPRSSEAMTSTAAIETSASSLRSSSTASPSSMPMSMPNSTPST